MTEPLKESTNWRYRISKRAKSIQVGRSKITDKAGKPGICKYSDVPTDALYWVNDLRYLPINFDIMEVRVQGKVKARSAWWDGKQWIGLRLRKGDVITAWKRDPYD